MELNIDQIRIVNQRPNGHCLVKGVAGSGKTTVAVNRIPTLRNHYIQSGEKILIITYNKTLINYTKYLMDFVDLQQNLFFEADPCTFIDIRTIDSIITKYNLKNAPEVQLADKQAVKEAMKQAIHTVHKSYADSTLLSVQNLQFLTEEIDWIKSCRYLERETYQNVDRQGRMSVGENRFRLPKNSQVRNEIFDLYLTYEAILEKEKLVDFKTSALRLLEAFEQSKIVPEKYPHIIVDESQDLTRVQLELLHYLYDDSKPTNSIMFIADAAQSIYTHSWLSNQSFKSVGFDMSGKSSILSKNYRTTFEIAKAAYSLMQHDDSLNTNDNFVQPTAIERHGKKPVLKGFSDQTKEAEYIASQIRLLSLNYSLKDMVILSVSTTYLTHLQDYLVHHGIDAEVFSKSTIDFSANKVRLITLHSIKGLEFPVVFIAGVNKGQLPVSDEQIPLGRKLLYVGMTRAKELLYLTHTVEPSMYIKELDATLLDTADAPFSCVYKVALEDYKYTDKIQNINSREEMVRQWMLHELHQRLSYPYASMDIEYPVQDRSASGFADIVIFDENRHPLIFVEVKSPGENMERAIKQLQSYLSCEPSVMYGVVSDGNHTQLLKRKINSNIFTKTQALPEFSKPSGRLYRTYTYHNLKSNITYCCKTNAEDHEDVILENNTFQETILEFSYEKVVRCGTVAAGALHYVSSEGCKNILLPDVFDIHADKHFLLKVSGDSMTDFGIEDEDMIVVQKQSYANAGDIVVAGDKTTNEATLKRYYPSSSMVTLIPGNCHYEPILIEPENLFINGVVVGVMKDMGTTRL